jgi:hypothetical protein
MKKSWLSYIGSDVIKLFNCLKMLVCITACIKKKIGGKGRE